MPVSPTVLAKKKKAEILAEYEALLKNFEEAQQGGALVHEPRSQEILAKSKDQTADQIRRTVTTLRETLLGSLQSIEAALLAETGRLTELREAAALAGQDLEHKHHVTVAAEALAQLVAEYEAKQRAFAAGAEQQRLDLEAELTMQRRRFEREQEELDYEAQRRRRRDEAQAAEERAERERSLDQRGAELKEREGELADLRRRVEELPAAVEKQVQQREKEIAQRLRAEAEAARREASQQWDSERRVFELRLNNLEEHIKGQQKEMAELKQEADRANKRAQELAVSIIKSGRPEPSPEREAAAAAA